jgi:peroxiredoxin Q/BCP
MIEEGRPAPDVELEREDGSPVRLSELRGTPVVLYFYPRDDTPGCTAQACGIRDAWGRFRASGAKVLGISADDAESHRAFREKYSLPFELLVDPRREAGEAFGVAQDDKRWYRRSTFVLDADGNVAKALENVDPQTHADEVLEALSV